VTPVVLCTCRAVFIAVVCSSSLVAVTAAVLTYAVHVFIRTNNFASRRDVASLRFVSLTVSQPTVLL